MPVYQAHIAFLGNLLLKAIVPFYNLGFHILDFPKERHMAIICDLDSWYIITPIGFVVFKQQQLVYTHLLIISSVCKMT